MELSKILFGDPILPVFGIEKSQLVKNTTQESGYSPTFLSKYHIGDVVLGKILENLGNGKGTFLLNGTVLAGYMPEYLKPNDVLSFQLQRSQTGDMALLLHSIPNSHNEKTRFTPEQIASLLGIEADDEGITSAIIALKNSGQPITKDAIFTLLRLVENTRSNPLLNSFSSSELFSTIETMLQEGVPLSEKNISLFAQSVGSFENMKSSFQAILQNGRIPESLPLRQAIIKLASSLVPVFNTPNSQKTSSNEPTKELEQLKQSLLDLGNKSVQNGDVLSTIFTSLLSGTLSKSDEKMTVNELYKQLSKFLLTHPNVTKEDIVFFLQVKQTLASEKSIKPEQFQESLRSLQAIIQRLQTTSTGANFENTPYQQQLQQLSSKLLLLSTNENYDEILVSLQTFMRTYEEEKNIPFPERKTVESILKQLYSLSDSKQVPTQTKMELFHSILRSEFSASPHKDVLPSLLNEFFNQKVVSQENSSLQLPVFKKAIEQLFQNIRPQTPQQSMVFRSDLEAVIESFFPKSTRNAIQKEVDVLLQSYLKEEIEQSKQIQQPNLKQIGVKEHFQNSYKEVISSAIETLKKFMEIPERSRTSEQKEVMKNISVLLHTLGAFEAYNTVANAEHLPMYMVLPMIVVMNKQRQFELKRIRIERHQAGEDKEMYQFGFAIPTNKLSEVNVRGSYLDKRITMQMFVESAAIKQTIESHQDELMDGLQEHGYSVVSMSITTKEQHQQLPPLHDSMKHDWRV